MAYISIVSPIYKAENIVDELVKRLILSLKIITEDFEIILIDDGSPDNSWNKIEQNCSKDKRVKGIKLSRNFGQHNAITAGLDYSEGEWIVVMDCDLQDRPEEITKLHRKALEGFDIVLAQRFQRKDNSLKKLASSLFYKSLTFLTGSEQDESVANFGIYNRTVVDAIFRMRESIRYFPTMVKWVGFKSTKVNVEHDSRFEGKSSYNLKKLLNLALDIILAYSDRPIRLLIKFGLIVSLFSFTFAIIVLFKWLNGEIMVLGFTSLIISIWFLCGIIISTLGLVGLYVGKTFEGVKNRPIYIVSKKTNHV